MPKPVLIASHDQKGDHAPHFDYPDLRNVMVPLMIPFMTCDADVKINVAT